MSAEVLAVGLKLFEERRVVNLDSLHPKLKRAISVFICVWALGVALWALRLASWAMLESRQMNVEPESVALFALGAIAPLLPFVEKFGVGGIADVTIPRGLPAQTRKELEPELERANEHIASIPIGDLDYEKLAALTK